MSAQTRLTAVWRHADRHRWMGGDFSMADLRDLQQVCEHMNTVEVGDPNEISWHPSLWSAWTGVFGCLAEDLADAAQQAGIPEWVAAYLITMPDSDARVEMLESDDHPWDVVHLEPVTGELREPRYALVDK